MVTGHDDDRVIGETVVLYCINYGAYAVIHSGNTCEVSAQECFYALLGAAIGLLQEFIVAVAFVIPVSNRWICTF